MEIPLAQSVSEKKFHPLSNAFGITFETGGTISKTDYREGELDFNGRLLIEYFFPSSSFGTIGLRFIGEGGYAQGQIYSDDIVYPPVSDKFRTGYLNFGGGLIFCGRFGNTVPYLSTCLTYIFYDPGDGNGNQLPNNQFSIYKKSSMAYSGEAGIRFPFHDSWSFNLGLNLNFTSTDYFDDIKAGFQNDAYIAIFAGVSFYLGKNIDSDNDGVDDNIDLCLSSPSGSDVDVFGCSKSDLNPADAVYDVTKEKFIADGIFTDGILFCFQVEIFKDIYEAQNLKNEITSKYYQTDIIKMNIGNLEWYSLRVGFFNSLEKIKIYRNEFFKQMK